MDQTVNVGDAFSDKIETPCRHVLLYVLLPTLVCSSSAYNIILHSFELCLLSFCLVLKCLKLFYFRAFFSHLFLLRQELPKFFRLDFSSFCKNLQLEIHLPTLP